MSYKKCLTSSVLQFPDCCFDWMSFLGILCCMVYVRFWYTLNLSINNTIINSNTIIIILSAVILYVFN